VSPRAATGHLLRAAAVLPPAIGHSRRTHRGREAKPQGDNESQPFLAAVSSLRRPPRRPRIVYRAGRELPHRPLQHLRPLAALVKSSPRRLPAGRTALRPGRAHSRRWPRARRAALYAGRPLHTLARLAVALRAVRLSRRSTPRPRALASVAESSRAPSSVLAALGARSPSKPSLSAQSACRAALRPDRTHSRWWPGACARRPLCWPTSAHARQARRVALRRPPYALAALPCTLATLGASSRRRSQCRLLACRDALCLGHAALAASSPRRHLCRPRTLASSPSALVMHTRHRTESYGLVTHHCCRRSTQSVDALDSVKPARDAEAEPDESAKVGV